MTHPKEGELSDPDLAQIERSYRELKDRLRDLGFVIAGSLTERWTTCGKTGCRCKADPPQRHGPYIEYTRKVAGKTTGRRLTPEQANLYRAWIANRRTLDQIIADMDELSQQAVRLLTNPAP
jgi:Family of unknown function (DUF6788)